MEEMVIKEVSRRSTFLKRSISVSAMPWTLQ